MNRHNVCCVNVLCKVVFYPTRSNPRWWYVIQTAPRSRHIFDEGGIEEVWREQAMDEEDETINFTSGEAHLAISEGERRGSKEETSSDDSSNESIDYSCDDYNIDDPLNSIDNNDMATSKSITSTSLGINLELVLEISQEDMLMDEVSTPLDE